MSSSTRFDHIKFDEIASRQIHVFKERCIDLEHAAMLLENPRAKALALTKLDEFYLWVGRAIRDDQIERYARIERPD